MSYTEKVWVDRMVEFAGRRKLTNVNSGESESYDVTRDEGEVFQTGNPFNAESMNDLETRISEEFSITPESTVVEFIEMVDALPSDAAAHPTTLYLVSE